MVAAGGALALLEHAPSIPLLLRTADRT